MYCDITGFYYNFTCEACDPLLQYITTSHKEILVDFANAEAIAFQASFGKDVAYILRVHLL